MKVQCRSYISYGHRHVNPTLPSILCGRKAIHLSDGTQVGFDPLMNGKLDVFYAHEL